MASTHIREVRTLRKLITILDFMECELQYRLTPLPELCRQSSRETSGILREVLINFACELDDQVSPDVQSCMIAAVSKVKDPPKLTREVLIHLGNTLGRFDLSGQLKGLEAVRQNCRSILGNLEKDKDVRVRSYQTLSLCAGAALAILLI